MDVKLLTTWHYQVLDTQQPLVVFFSSIFFRRVYICISRSQGVDWFSFIWTVPKDSYICIFRSQSVDWLSLILTVTNLILITFSVVKAYQYTSITSVMLLDCFTIPCVIIFTRFFLKTKYRIKKLTGASICIAGIVIVIFSDVHASDRAGKHVLFYQVDFSFVLLFYLI